MLNALRDSVSRWAVLAVWVIVLIAAYLWAFPIFANAHYDVLCSPDQPCPSGVFYTANEPTTSIVALVAATLVTALLAGGMVAIRRLKRG